MAARWQQWMPFHIDRFRGSPDVQAMHPAARCGFLYLLAAAWQTDDCSLSCDPMDLATASGLGDELWAMYGARILRKFEMDGGRLLNRVLLVEWTEAKAIYDKRKLGAQRTNSERSPSAVRTQSERNADTVTGTGTETTTGTEAKASAPSAQAPQPEPNPLTALRVVIGTLPLNTGESFEITDAMVNEWAGLYGAVDVVQQLKNMKGWCLANPKNLKTKGGIRKFIASWLAKEQNQARPVRGASHGTSQRTAVAPSAERQQRSDDSIDAAVELLTGGRTSNPDEAGKSQLSIAGTHPRHGRDVVGLVVRDGGRPRPGSVQARSTGLSQGEALSAVAR